MIKEIFILSVRVTAYAEAFATVYAKVPDVVITKDFDTYPSMLEIEEAIKQHKGVEAWLDKKFIYVADPKPKSVPSVEPPVNAVLRIEQFVHKAHEYGRTISILYVSISIYTGLLDYLRQTALGFKPQEIITYQGIQVYQVARFAKDQIEATYLLP